MQPTMFLHRRQVHSVFDLLGHRENDITYSVGWALAQCPQFRRAFLKYVFGPDAEDTEVRQVALQHRGGDEGITDIELKGEDLHLIVEAKRGWQVPTERQLRLYEPRLRRERRRFTGLVAMSECGPEFAARCLVRDVDGIPVKHLGWREVERLTRVQRARHAEKRLLEQLRSYFEEFVMMQPQDSNLVYVVALGTGLPPKSSVSWIDIAVKHRRYFHPVGGSGWPKEPPNYIGFRYHGRLQSIHHIEAYKVVKEFAPDIPGVEFSAKGDHFMYTLGPAIKPAHDVVTGKVFRNGRVWAALDLLLTSKSVSEARDKTKARRRDE